MIARDDPLYGVHSLGLLYPAPVLRRRPGVAALPREPLCRCIYCGAHLWTGLRGSTVTAENTGTAANPTSTLCCGRGKVVLPYLRDPPEPLLSYLRDATPAGRHLREHLRYYNSNLQFASTSARVGDTPHCGSPFLSVANGSSRRSCYTAANQ